MKAKKTIMLVEDEDAILFSMQRLLELTGEYEIITAHNGKKALQKMKNLLPDMIISDIVMPEMDGLEFCKKIRNSELTRNTPFIFLTAKKELMVDGIKAGGDDFILKPFTFDEVVVKIEAIFRRIENTRQQASQLKGNLADHNLDGILQLCSSRSLSGELVLQSGGEVGKIMLDKGEIAGIIFRDLSDDKALDVLRSWKEGIFAIRPMDVKLQPRHRMEQEKDGPQNKMDSHLEIASHTYWVGYRNVKSSLQINVYLRQFRSRNKILNLVIDPGSPIDFISNAKKIATVIDNISKINLYSLGSPEPDVCMNSVFIRNANPKAICLTSEENWRTVSHYEINPKSVKLINTFRDNKVSLATGHTLQFIPVPFCHHKGSYMIYDLETRVLFSGTLFSGILNADRIFQLYAEEEDWDGIRNYHQVYIPANRALRMALSQIKKLKPVPLVIAPHHGALIRGQFLEQITERLSYLDVGTDLMISDEDNKQVQNYLQACNEFLEYTLSYITLDQITQRIYANAQLAPLCEYKNGRVRKIYSRPKEVYQLLVRSMIRGDDARIDSQLKSIALKIAFSKGLPPPVLDWDQTETLISLPEHIFQKPRET